MIEVLIVIAILFGIPLCIICCLIFYFYIIVVVSFYGGIVKWIIESFKRKKILNVTPFYFMKEYFEYLNFIEFRKTKEVWNEI